MKTLRPIPAEDTLPDIAPLKAVSGIPADETLVDVAPVSVRNSDRPVTQAKGDCTFVCASGFSGRALSGSARRESASRSAWRRWYPPCRAALDFAAALVLLILSAPVVLLAMALVRLTSRGPAIYSQTRLGKGGRLYTIYKLRSMYQNCERKSGPCWSRPGDPRVTPVGRGLRLTHIDELPQLWNVLRGDMSLIGPRPERPEIAKQLERDVPRYSQRLRVRPGITGFAQVQLPADSDIPGVRRKVAFDLHYIETMSLWLDLRILVCTGLKVLGVPLPVLRMVFTGPPKIDLAEFVDIPARADEVLTQAQPA